MNAAIARGQYYTGSWYDSFVKDHIFIREHDERVQEHPPDQQHQEIQSAGVKLVLLQRTMRTQSRRHERHDVEEQNHISHKGIG